LNPQDLLAQRQPDYAKARDRHNRAVQARAQAEQRTQELERKLADAEDADRLSLGDALVDGKKPPARKTERVRTALAKAKEELAAVQYAVERTGQELDRMPVEHKRDWLRQAERDFEAARADYEQQLAQLAEGHERVAEEAALVNFLGGEGSSVRLKSIVRVPVGDIEGLAHEVAVLDVLEALRHQLYDLEGDVLLRGVQRGG
jgi:hypothetical protein